MSVIHSSYAILNSLHSSLAREHEKCGRTQYLDNRQGVYTMRVMHLKSEIAQRKQSDLLCGEGGIRTHGGYKTHNGFRDRPIRPLWHLSMSVIS